MLVLSILACRPVIAIGWEEFVFALLLFLFLFGPPLYRLLRRIEDFRRRDRKRK